MIKKNIFMLLKWLSKNNLIFLVGIICLSVGYCRDFEDCRSLYTSFVVIEFVPEGKHSQQSISFQEIESNNIEYTKDQSNTIKIGLNPAANYTTIYLKKAGFYVGERDYITIFYQRYPSLLSPLCGAQQKYVLDSLETTFAGSKIIQKIPKIPKPENEKANVQIFY